MKYDYQKKYSEYSNSDLIKFHNNARITYYGCIGHFKSQQNEGIMSMIARELKNRGMVQDSIDQCCWLMWNKGVLIGVVAW